MRDGGVIIIYNIKFGHGYEFGFRIIIHIHDNYRLE